MDIYLSFFEFFDNDFIIHNIYIPLFILCMYTNFSLNVIIKHYKFDFDLIYKYFWLVLKTPNFFFNYFLNTLKKIYLFLYHFKYRQNNATIRLIYKKYSNFLFIIWKPLFKKISYFGYFRSNRSKWIK